MKTPIGKLAGTLLALMLTSPLAQAASKITVAVGGGACFCYLPTDAVLVAFSEGSPEVAKANVDASKTFTNRYVDEVKKTTGMNDK